MRALVIEDDPLLQAQVVKFLTEEGLSDGGEEEP